MFLYNLLDLVRLLRVVIVLYISACMRLQIVVCNMCFVLGHIMTKQCECP